MQKQHDQKSDFRYIAGVLFGLFVLICGVLLLASLGSSDTEEAQETAEKKVELKENQKKNISDEDFKFLQGTWQKANNSPGPAEIDVQVEQRDAKAYVVGFPPAEQGMLAEKAEDSTIPYPAEKPFTPKPKTEDSAGTDDNLASDECVIGQIKPCGTDLGECVKGVQTCLDTGDHKGIWSECGGAFQDRQTEVCDGLDNNCNGDIDEGCECVPGDVHVCGTDQGECTTGVQTCLPNGTWGKCSGVFPTEELCDMLDNDCDGDVDEGCACTESYTQPCGTDLGACSIGTQTCANGMWGPCVGEIENSPEICDTIDNDCDGYVDEGCSCIESDTQPCGTDLGACSIGIQTCVNGMWGPCVGEVKGSPEKCDNIDNDCDGDIDEGC